MAGGAPLAVATPGQGTAPAGPPRRVTGGGGYGYGRGGTSRGWNQERCDVETTGAVAWELGQGRSVEQIGVDAPEGDAVVAAQC